MLGRNPILKNALTFGIVAFYTGFTVLPFLNFPVLEPIQHNLFDYVLLYIILHLILTGSMLLLVKANIKNFNLRGPFYVLIIGYTIAFIVAMVGGSIFHNYQGLE